MWKFSEYQGVVRRRLNKKDVKDVPKDAQKHPKDNQRSPKNAKVFIQMS